MDDRPIDTSMGLTNQWSAARLIEASRRRSPVVARSPGCQWVARSPGDKHYHRHPLVASGCQWLPGCQPGLNHEGPVISTEGDRRDRRWLSEDSEGRRFAPCAPRRVFFTTSFHSQRNYLGVNQKNSSDFCHFILSSWPKKSGYRRV